MNHSYQYTNGGIRGEHVTQGQGEENHVYGNRTASDLGVVLPSLTQNPGEAMKTIMYESIKKRYDSDVDPHAKKNRDNTAQELRERGYLVWCSRTTNLRGRNIYLLNADKTITEESIHV